MVSLSLQKVLKLSNSIIVIVSKKNVIEFVYGFDSIIEAESCFKDMLKLHGGSEFYMEDLGTYLEDGYFASTNGTTISIENPQPYT
jgi:hypothetical protein